MTPFLGTEFIPRLDEGYLTPQVIRLPSVSVPQSIEIERQMQQALMKFPEVVAVVSKMGAAEIAVDPMGPNLSDPIVVLKPRAGMADGRHYRRTGGKDTGRAGEDPRNRA